VTFLSPARLASQSYNGFTVGMRKRFSQALSVRVELHVAKDKDDDSNERDPFTDRSLNPLNLSLDYALTRIATFVTSSTSLRYIELGWGFEGNFRVQGRTAQPITPGVRTATNRNTARKDNEYFSFDWRIQRPFKLGERFAIIPIIEMFNTFNNANNINPLVTPGLFQFRRVPASGCGRSASGAVGGEVYFLI
jgi:hypothetical protein